VTLRSEPFIKSSFPSVSSPTCVGVEARESGGSDGGGATNGLLAIAKARGQPDHEHIYYKRDEPSSSSSPLQELLDINVFDRRVLESESEVMDHKIISQGRVRVDSLRFVVYVKNGVLEAKMPLEERK